MSDWSTLRKLMWLRGTTGGGGSPLTVSGPTPLLMPGALAKPMRAASFAISPVQSGSGDPSPSNVRPITGWTGCTAWVSGGNIFKYPFVDTTKTDKGITFTDLGDGQIKVSGTNTSSSSFATFELLSDLDFGPDSHNFSSSAKMSAQKQPAPSLLEFEPSRRVLIPGAGPPPP